LDAAESAGFELLPILRHLARSTPPRLLNTNGALLSVVAAPSAERTRDQTMRIAVVAHIFYEDMVDELVDLTDNLPGPYDLVITTPDQDRARTIREQLASRARTWGALDIRVLGSNNGRDQGAFLVACRDLIVGDDYDLLVKVHSKKTVQDGFNIGRHFKQQQLLNLLDTPAYVDGLVDLFRNEPGLGLVYPPTIHIGYPTMGRGWWSNKSGFAALAAQLGITVPLDDVSPLAPYGSMYIARPAALRRMVEREWSFADFGGADAYQDGGLAHILERLPSYAAAEDGYYTRTVMTADYTAISHTSFEYNLDQLSVTIPGRIDEQVSLIRRLGFFGQGRAADVLRMYLRSHAPRHSRAVDRWETRIRRVRSRLRRS
jgi:rhamnosyltransferase